MCVLVYVCVYVCVCVLCAVCIWYNSPVFRDPNTDPSEHLTNYIYNTCTNVNNYTTLYIQYSCEYYENKDDEISMCVCVCVRVRVCMCSSKILENHQSRNTKKKKRKKKDMETWRGEGTGVRILVDRNYRATRISWGCLPYIYILATILTLHYPIIVTNHPTYIHKKIIKERQRNGKIEKRGGEKRKKTQWQKWKKTCKNLIIESFYLLLSR